MTDYSLSITPGMAPADRHRLEDQLDEFLVPYSGASTGGGTMLDGSGSDLDFECEGEHFAESLKAFLAENANIDAKIKLMRLEDSNEIFTIQCTKQKKWWQFWL